MQKFDINKILEQVQSGKLSVAKAAEAFKHLPVKAMDFANVDTHRAMRSGFPEVVFCQGKTQEQVVAIMKEIVKHSGYCLGTRADVNVAKAVQRAFGKRAEYNKQGRTILVKNPKNIKRNMPNSSPAIFNRGLRSFISSIRPSSNIMKEDNITPDNFIAGNLIKNRLNKTAARNAM